MTSITTLSTSILPDIEETQFRIEGLVTPNIVDLSTTKPSITVETTEGKIEIDNPAQLLEFITLNQSAEIVSINYSVELNGPHTVNVDTITNVLRTEVQEISVEVLGYGGSGGGVLVDYDSVFAWGGADQANAVVNSRFFSSLYGWEFSGVANRILRTDLTVPADAPSQYVARFGGQYARYISRKLDVIPNENVFVGVMLATNALSAPDIMVKVVRYAADDTLIGESLIDTIAQTSTWHRVAESYDVPADGTARLEFLLEITGAGPAYDANKRWYFTNAALYSTASDLLVNARIDAEITTRASADSALASSLSTVSTTVGGHTTSISALSSSVNGLNAQWGVSINVDGVITGAVRLDTVNSFSTFAVRADKFVVTNSNNTEGGAPFELVGGVAFIKQAVIPDLTTRNLLVKNSGNIKVIDSQITPVTRVEIGSIGADYGLIVRNAAGAVIFNVDSLGANTVNSTQLVSGAVTPGKTNIAAINSGSGNLNSDVVDVANIINGAVTAAKTNLAAINSGTGNLNSNTVDTAQIIASAVTAAKTNLAAINSSTGNLNSNTVDTAQIIASAVTAAKTNLAAINSSTGNLNSNTVDTAQIINGAISDAAKFSNSIRPVEVVATLPVTGNFDGRTVFLTTDKKIYRYDAVAGSYTASVPAGDLSGQITGTQITDGSITTPKIAANAVTAAQIAANTITAAQIAANTITAGQIAAGTITGDRVAANTITASRLLITNSYNMVADADLQDTNYWVYQTNGITINSSDSIVTTNLGIRAAWKSANGNGTLSQAANEAGSSLMIVEAGKPYRFYIKTAVTSGFTGVNVLYILWYKRDGSASSITPLSSFAGADYRAVASGGIVTFTIDGQVTAPSDAHYMRIQPTTLWSTVINNAGNGYLGLPQVNRANNGELIVDGTITAAKIQAGTITGDRIAANTITASRLLITNSYNMIPDADLQDASFWSINPSWSINTADSAVTSDLQARAAFKSVTGNGTTSQANTYVNQLSFFVVEPNKFYRASSISRVTAGFTGRAAFGCYWYTQAGVYISASYVFGPNYRTVAAVSATTSTIEGQVTAPSNAYYGRFSATVDWSTTLNNAGNAYFAFLQFNRANSGELIVDGTITAAKIAAATIVASNIAANAITASKLTLSDTTNIILDPFLSDAAYWNTAGGTIDSSDAALVTMGVPRAWKTPVGNGTLSQPSNYAQASAATPFAVEPGKYYRYYYKYFVKAGFTGYLQPIINWYDKNGSLITNTQAVTVDYRTSAAPADVNAEASYLFLAPATSALAHMYMGYGWSTTINNAQYALASNFRLSRAVNAELIVDGTITAAKIAANTITAGQIAAGTITATQIAANSITASRLLITSAENLIADADLRDSNYWTLLGGATINTADSIVTSNMGLRVAFKSATGNGTTSQTASQAKSLSIMVESGKVYRASARFAVTAGFTAINIIYIHWFKQDGSASTTPFIAVVGTDYRISPAPSIAVQTVDAQVTAPSDAYFCTVTPTSQWSTTINNAGIGYQGLVYFNRANSGELIVDGAITAAKIAANTITASQIAANTITAGQIAAGTITGDKIAANTITAGKLILSDVTSYITDPLFLDSSYWSLSGGTIETSDAALATMNVPKAWKSPVGNGTLSQSTVFLTTAVAPSYPYVCEPGRGYRVSFKYFIKTGFTGLLQPAITWFDRNGTIIITDAPTTGDWRTTPAGSDINSEYSTIFTAPANAAYMTFYMLITWSTTVNNAQYVLISQWRVIRATNAELIVDGTITAAKIAANTITASQIAANTITATQMSANSITASKLSIGEPSLLLDSNFDDQTYWLLGAGASGYDTSTETTTTLGLPRSVKSVLGNGTTSQAANGLVQLRNSNYYIPVEGGRPIRLSAKAFYKAGFTGTLRVIVNWYKQDKTTLASVSNSQLAGTNYTTVAAASDTIEEINGIVTAPADACFALYYIYQYWSTTLNNAQYCLVGRPRANKAINAELIVDGTITAAKITAGTITSAQIATDAIKSSDWNATTKQGWLLGTNGSIQASSIEIWSPGVSPKKIFGASGMSYNGSSFYGLDQIITKINKAAEDGSPDSLVFDGTNPDTWVDLCDIAITATGGHDIDVECLTDLLIEQLYNSAYAFDLSKIAGAPDFQLRVRRTQGSTVDIYTSPWYKLSTVGQLPAQIFRVRDTTAVAGAATYLLQAKWRKGTYSAGTISKGAFDTFVTGTGVSWLANIGADNSPLSTWYQATGAITFSGQPSAGNTITFNSIVITFVAGSPGANQVQIGANLNTTITNLANALNLHGDSHISVATYANVGGTQLSITHDAPGTVGNAYTLAKSGANITISGSVLTGGSDGYAAWEIQVSSVDPNWFPIIQLNNRAKLTLHPSGYVPLIAPSLSGASYAVRANYHAVMMRLVNYTIRTTEFRNTAVT